MKPFKFKSINFFQEELKSVSTTAVCHISRYYTPYKFSLSFIEQILAEN